MPLKRCNAPGCRSLIDWSLSYCDKHKDTQIRNTIRMSGTTKIIQSCIPIIRARNGDCSGKKRNVNQTIDVLCVQLKAKGI